MRPISSVYWSASSQGLNGLQGRVDALNQGDAAGAGFSRAGFGRGQQVPSAENMGKGLLLDGSELLVAH